MKQFADRHSKINTLSDLRGLIHSYSSPLEFSVSELNYRDAARAETLLRVIDYLVLVQQHYQGATEEARLHNWAAAVVPSDWTSVGVRGFGLSGFQYLRMLLGVQTTKPDIHIRRFVGRVDVL